MSNTIKHVLKQFLTIVKQTYSPKARIILFGSYAKGKEKKWSDIDVAVIFPKVKDSFNEEKNLRLLSLNIDERINPFVFSESDLKENSPLTWEIKKYGKEVTTA